MCSSLFFTGAMDYHEQLRPAIHKHHISDHGRSLSPYSNSTQKLNRARNILSKEQVIEIFENKKTLSRSERITSGSIRLARKFHVSSKTIRDIWNRKTWHDTTLALCQEVIRSHITQRVMTDQKYWSKYCQNIVATDQNIVISLTLRFSGEHVTPDTQKEAKG